MTRKEQRGKKRSGWTRWLAAGFLVAFVASSALAGFAFVWCIPLGQAKLACCCHVATQLDGAQSLDTGAPKLAPAPCCEVRKVDALTSAETPRHALPDIAAPAVCVLPPAQALFPAPAGHAAPLFAAPAPLPEGRAPPLIQLYKRHLRFLI